MKNDLDYTALGWTLTDNVDIEYRSHIDGWDCTEPDRWLSARACNTNGDTAKVWWYWEHPEEEDGGDWVDNWDLCHDVAVDV